MMLQALAERHVLGKPQRLAVALTKLDEIEASGDKTRVERDFVSLVDKIRELFGKSLESIDDFRLAASPETDILPRGHGLAELFAYWMRKRAPETLSRPAQLAPSRAFGRLALPSRML
jgi:hypothetical protein